MLLSKMTCNFQMLTRLAAIVTVGFILTACQFEPLHGNRSAGNTAGGLAGVGVSHVDSRVGQQVRNHLLFLFNGGNGAAQKTHEARIRVSWNNKLLSAVTDASDLTAGTVTVTVSYDLVEMDSGKIIASGNRKAIASYDRTGQVYANERATRDAENRAAKEAAEALRLAIASDLNRARS